jgi:hypothetical protein
VSTGDRDELVAAVHGATTISNPMEYIGTDDPEVIGRYRHLSALHYACYEAILNDCPASAERTLAIRKLQEARMWANAAIAFDGRRYPV